MSSREPLWFCHQCHAEMRPLMTPEPICASCRGSFVEKLENPSDDPRDFQHLGGDDFDAPDVLLPSMDGFLRGLRNTVDPSRDPFQARSRSPPSQRNTESTVINFSCGGFRFEMHSAPGGRTRTFVLGGPNTLGRPSDQRERAVPTMSDFLQRENPQGRHAHDITGPLMAQYLLALMGHGPTTRGDPFAELLGVQGGRWGDYVFNQEALDQIMTQLMENSTAGRPVPATEEIIKNLHKEVLTENSPILEKDCAVCKEQFKLDTDDPDELVVVTLPCTHPFHEGCIFPWLKSSGTCPVCRYALIPQPQQHAPNGTSGGSSSPHSSNPSGSGSRSPGPSGRSGSGGFFHSFFGGSTGSGSSGSGTHYSRSQGGPDVAARRAPTQGASRGTPPFPGQWIEDLD
ncbi:hypothetical protein F5I97DRAFT_1809016 [Phlebopus sp. FC_14]|nr:hypothetical protein F5I97DRAFT_1809016 [Phlebopus sp. FC_14]